MSNAIMAPSTGQEGDLLVEVPRIDPNAMVVNNMRGVRNHTRHSIFYVFWAAIYLYLTFVQQPISHFFINLIDWFWKRLPIARKVRDTAIELLVNVVSRMAPEFAGRCLTYDPLGEYVGSDSERPPGERKQVPFHSVSLDGCAWMMPYHIGVCEVLKRQNVVDERTIWLGSSCGALIATAVVLDLDLEYELKFCISLGSRSNESHALGPIGRMSQYIAPHVDLCLPEDAHVRASNRLLISVTETPYGERICGNRLLRNFRNRKHIRSALMASTYIPIYYERPVPPGLGVFYWDGGFTNNHPVLKDQESGRCLTTTVSPLTQKADISPERQYRCRVEHLVPGDARSAMEIYESGKRDAEAYVARLRQQSYS